MIKGVRIVVKKFEEYMIDDVMKIWLDENISAHDFISKTYWQNNYDLVKNEYIPNSDIYVFIEYGLILGFISIVNQNFVGALFVKSNHHGEGVGQALLKFSLEKYKFLKLNVYVKNSSAIEFYKKFGFRIIDERVNKESLFAEYNMCI